jgi:pyruvate, water dikinase
MNPSDDVLPLCRCSKESHAHVGGKNANLGEMLNQRFPVPDGFAVSVRAYERAVASVRGEIDRRLRDLDPADAPAVEAASVQIRQLIRRTGMPDDVKELIGRHYARLAEQSRVADVPVAVRSSATAEDLPGASFAGQQDTYLWVCGHERVAQSVIECWGSLFTARAIAYRAQRGFRHDEVAISVGVQQMVRARSAGVMFTLNPVNGDRSRITIGGSWGLGEGVVGGEVDTDEWTVDKVLLEVSGRRVADKGKRHVVRQEGGREKVVVEDVSPELRKEPCLSDPEVLQLARIGKALERHYGRPQDIEWAVDVDLPFPQNLFILQARPETVWSVRSPAPVLGKSTSIAGQVAGFYSGLRG